MLFSYYQVPGFNITKEAVWGHTTHCIEAIRESLMCNADATLLNKVDGLLPGEGQMRTCKNFDAYKEWAELNAYTFPDSD